MLLIWVICFQDIQLFLLIETGFNQDIGDWDTSNVTNMGYMFQGNKDFNQNISGWDTSNVTNMFGMFYSAKKFNQSINTDGSKWNVSKVTNMGYMFNGASEFNGNISGWDVSGVSSMVAMFSDAADFNQNIGGWDVLNVADMRWMFYRAVDFNQDLTGWRICRVTSSNRATFSDGTNNWQPTNKPLWTHPCVVDFDVESKVYKEGDVINITMNFSESVYFGVNSTLELRLDGGDVNATYSAGNGTESLVFSYVVRENDSSSDLDWTGAGALVGSISAVDDDKVGILTMPVGRGSLAGRFGVVVDTANPMISNVVPVEGSYLNDRTPTINFSVNESNLDVVELYVDGVKVSGLVNSGSDYSYTHTSDLGDGNHTFTIFVNDSVGNDEVNETYGFVIDVTNPVISAVLPVNNSNLSDATPTINFTVTEVNLDVVELFVDGVKVSGLSNVSDDYSYALVSNLSEGVHSFTVSVSDIAGNEVNETYGFLVDTVEPVISAVLPVNNSNLSDATPTINFTVTEVNLDVVELFVDGVKVSGLSNVSDDYSYALVSNLSEGVHSFRIFVNDSSGNGLNRSHSFLVDTIDPVVSAVLPVDNSNLSDATPTINFTVTEVNLDVVELFVDGVKVNGLSNVSDDYSYTLVSNLSEGVHSFRIFVNDSSGNGLNNTHSFFG